MYNRETIARFGVVGVINTAVDVSIFLFLRSLNFTILVANLSSTSAALIVSFFLNHSYTFQNKSVKSRRQFVKFIIITLFGLWVLQPLVIKLFLLWNSHVNYTNLLPTLGGQQFISADFVSKMAATIISMAWNYIWYSKYIFEKPNKNTDYRKPVVDH